MPEVVVDGATGFVCRTLRESIAPTERVPELDRAACRGHVEQHFAPAATVGGYERAGAGLVDRLVPDS